MTRYFPWCLHEGCVTRTSSRQLRLLGRRNLSSRRRGHLISRHINIIGKNINYIMWPETKKDCAGEGQWQFTGLNWTDGELWVVALRGWSSGMTIVTSRYLTTASDRITHRRLYAIVVIFNVCKLMRLFSSFVVTNYKCSVNPITNPNSVSIHTQQYKVIPVTSRGCP
jgi:hypothetical protein